VALELPIWPSASGPSNRVRRGRERRRDSRRSADVSFTESARSAAA
jgi:hypothetical protein